MGFIKRLLGLQPTGLDLVNATLHLFATEQLWYSQQDPRCNPDWSHHADCSGLCCWALNKVGVGYSCSNSWAMAQQGHREGLGMPLSQAVNTPGAWFVIGANEGQTNINNRGHIGMFVGDGVHTLEARGHFAGVGVFTWQSLGFINYCMRAPGINYSKIKPAPPVTPKVLRGDDTMILLPETASTPTGRGAFAISDFQKNRVKLANGARILGDQPDESKRASLRYWAPPAKDWVAGMQIIGTGDGRFDKSRPENIIVVSYEAPNGDTLTFRGEIDMNAAV